MRNFPNDQIFASFAVFLLIILNSGCASLQTRSATVTSLNASSEPTKSQDSEVSNDDDPKKEPTVSSLTLDSNEKVESWVRYFTKTDRERFQRFLNRGKKYRKIVEDVLVENDLPPELYFLALIESGYQNHATSSARAAGVWQFMPATARRYGLQVNRYVDERRDPIRATEAAAKYLRDLYNIFGSWPLAMAAYNAGEYRIIRSIIQGKSRDYWTLVTLNVLPKETADYVAKLIAAATIGSDPEKYGFNDDLGEPYPELETVEVPSPIRLSDLAKQADLRLEELREYNPHLWRELTPRNVSRYEVWLPKESAAKLSNHLTQLTQLRLSQRAPNRQIANNEDASDRAKYHRVKPGENLTLIAQRYGISVNHLLKVNSLRSSQPIFPGMKLRLISRAYYPKKIVRYRVKAGETLDRIARHFGISVKNLKDDNTIKSNRIYVHQVLIIRNN